MALLQTMVQDPDTIFQKLQDDFNEGKPVDVRPRRFFSTFCTLPWPFACPSCVSMHWAPLMTHARVTQGAMLRGWCRC